MVKKTSIQHIQSLKEFEGLKQDWEHLLDQYKNETIFLTWEWLYAWWKHNQEGKRLWLLTARQDNNLVGIAPLMLSSQKKHGMSFRLLQTLGTPNTDQSDFIALDNDPEIVIQFCNYILTQKNTWDAIELNEHKDEDATTHIITNALVNHKLITKINTNLHHHVAITESWEGYLKSLSKNMRRDMEKCIRHTKEKQSVNLKCFRGPDVKWEHFETFFEINKNGHFPEKYKSETERAFHRELFEIMHTKNWIEVVLLYFDDVPVAYEYGFNLNGRFEDWRTGYDTNYSDQAVGKLLLILLMRDLFENGYNDFDFLRGEYEHKDRWRPSSRKFLNIVAVRPNHLQARIALIILPKIWHWVKKHIQHKQGS
ncbi:MAG: GNAT family N-acetyltransferase [Anaerolineales bacterium]|uniref:GNAT family N-acetyltransferase n=1 Tax=Candidatus Villigracilis proximus TaxID=3140683 RepID=UPI0031350A07|nr:GNAT family N-acetyltransferase [Anaerolineales bacterium]